MQKTLKHELFCQQQTISPKQSFVQNALYDAEKLYEEARIDRLGFWHKQAEHLDWIIPPQTVLEWNPPHAKWFSDGKLNACYNCVDRHCTDETRNKAALIWEGENGQTRTHTYWDLYREVNKCANVLKSLQIKKGDTVAIYLPMIPEAIICMLACARIGAVHTVVFGGFSALALQERLIDANAKLLITSDGGFRRGTSIRLKDAADMACLKSPFLQKMLVIRHTKQEIQMQHERDYWYHECMSVANPICPVEPMEAEDTLFILYTSGTTGKPKGIVHTTGGYMVGATYTTKLVFDAKPSDVYWCTADVGWITGHTYVTYGPLSNGMTQVLYEGAPDFPNRDRTWQIIEKYGVTILYTAPTLIRTFMKWGLEHLKGYNLSSLRLLGSVGEPINPECWMWYYTHVGESRCPIVDTWWQTETGSIMIAPVPSHTPLKPGSATFALPGIDAKILLDDAIETTSGTLSITSPWPSMARGIHNDMQRFKDTYWNKWDGLYYNTSDGAMQDEDGYFWLMGRIDDVMNVSGHRIGTMEVESALVDHAMVAEAAVIGVPHTIKGQGIVAFVSLKLGCKVDDAELKAHVVEKIGAIARPERIIFTQELPKTRSGKIMRRLLRDIGEGKVVGDLTTIADASIIADLKQKYTDD